MRYLDENMAAERLGLSARSLQRFRATGDGPAYARLGLRRIGYAEEALTAWAAARTYQHRAAEMAARAEREPA